MKNPFSFEEDEALKNMKKAIFLEGMPFNTTIEDFVVVSAANMLERGFCKYEDLYENNEPNPRGFKEQLHRVVELLSDKDITKHLGEGSRVQKMKLRSQLDDLRTENPDFFKFITGSCSPHRQHRKMFKFSLDGGAFNATINVDYGINKETELPIVSGYPNYMFYASFENVARKDFEITNFFLDLENLNVSKVEKGYEFDVISVNDKKPIKHRIRLEEVCEIDKDNGMYKSIALGNTVFYVLRKHLSLYVNEKGWAVCDSKEGTCIFNALNEASQEENFNAAVEWLDANGLFIEGEKPSLIDAQETTRKFGRDEITEILKEKNVSDLIRQSPIIKELDTFLHLQAKSCFKRCTLHFPALSSSYEDYREIPLPKGMERAFGLKRHRYPMNIAVGKNYFTVRVEISPWRYIYLCKESFEGDRIDGYKAALEWCLDRDYISNEEKHEMEKLDLENYNEVNYTVRTPWTDGDEVHVVG